jgi:hypothetical protein
LIQIINMQPAFLAKKRACPSFLWEGFLHILS